MHAETQTGLQQVPLALRCFDIIRDLFRNFVFEYFPIRKGASLMGAPCPLQLVHTVASACAAYHVGHVPLVRQLEALNAIGPVADYQGRVKYLISVEQIEAAVARLSKTMNKLEACSYLGMERLAVNKLVNVGHIKCDVSGSALTPRFSMQELDRFLATLTEIAHPITHSEHGYVSLAEAARRSHIGADRILTDVMDGTLTLYVLPDHADEKPLDRYGLDKLELKKALGHLPTGMMTLSEAARNMAVNVRTMRELCLKGRIYSQIVRSNLLNRSVRAVSTASLDGFSADHIALRTMAGSKSEKFQALAGQLRAAGISSLDLLVKSYRICRREDLANYKGIELRDYLCKL